LKGPTRLHAKINQLKDSRSPVSRVTTIATSILVSCTRIGGGNLQSCLVESLRNLLCEKLGFFNSNFRVRVICKKPANRRGDDCIHLVRINHYATRTCELLYRIGGSIGSKAVIATQKRQKGC
jgi:hypothetical protein